MLSKLRESREPKFFLECCPSNGLDAKEKRQ